MAKKAKKSPQFEFDPRKFDAASAQLLECAKCLDGRGSGDCHFADRCDDTVMQRMLACVDLTEQIQNTMSDNALDSVHAKVNGFLFQTTLTGEFGNKVSKTAAEAAMTLQYTADVRAGRRAQ